MGDFSEQNLEPPEYYLDCSKLTKKELMEEEDDDTNT